MGIISVEQADRLYWLGRYTERVYTTLRMFCQSFDVMIDELGDSYREFCKKLDIPDSYGDKAAFLKQYPFDCENPDSIISNLDRAYGNAVVLRESIGSEALSYIQLAVYEMNKASASKAPLIELQHVIDDLLASGVLRMIRLTRSRFATLLKRVNVLSGLIFMPDWALGERNWRGRCTA